MKEYTLHCAIPGTTGSEQSTHRLPFYRTMQIFSNPLTIWQLAVVALHLKPWLTRTLYIWNILQWYGIAMLTGGNSCGIIQTLLQLNGSNQAGQVKQIDPNFKQKSAGDLSSNCTQQTCSQTRTFPRWIAVTRLNRRRRNNQLRAIDGTATTPFKTGQEIND